jgi:hypothetical protein
MYTPEELERIYKEAMKDLKPEERMAVGVIIKKISELSLTSIAIGELLSVKCPELFEEGAEIGELNDEVRKLIDEYNITSDQETTLICMLPSQAMRDTFGIPPKINL